MSTARAPPNSTVTSRWTCQLTLLGPKYPRSAFWIISSSQYPEKLGSRGEHRRLLDNARGARHDTAPRTAGGAAPMIVVALFLALAIAAGIAAGCSIRSLEGIRIHWWGIAFIALALQALPISGGNEDRIGLAAASLVASYVLLLAVVVVNRRVPGAAFMAAGLM